MEVKILGTGGFENEGLPFNSFLVDGHLLVETPPDILQSLRRENVDLAEIDTIVITHFHGDHCFGLPFLLFNLYLTRSARLGELRASPLKLIAPFGLRDWMKTILGLAISPGHPYVEWSISALDSAEIGEGERMDVAGGLWLDFYKAEHSPETYSVLVGRGEGQEPLLIATSDTKWSPRLATLLARGGRLVLCDSGGKGNDDADTETEVGPNGESWASEVHMSPAEIEARVLPLLRPDTRLVATHFSADPPRTGTLSFAKCGDVYRI
ncbi:MAG TPA: MBL fold metallo-hydrolase [Rectinemataceae bacterium]|nr:MBL fold metallo-hydrolase [Rectinemataceae bacterium]